MAPEQLTYPATLTDKTDVYSLGVLIFEVLTGELPYADIREDMQVVDAIKQGHKNTIERTGEWSSLMMEALQRLWTDQDSRLSAAQVVDMLIELRGHIQPKVAAESAKLKRLTSGTQYTLIRNEIEGKFSGTSGQRILVTSIFSVDNAARDAKFNTSNRNCNADNVESLLHGTSKQALRSIFNTGFREPTPTEAAEMNQAAGDDDYASDSSDASDNGMQEPMSATVTSSRTVLKFGSGIYFTTDVGKAAHYSEERNSKVLLLCDVASGQSMMMTTSNTDIDMKYLKERDYDSVRHDYSRSGTKFKDVVVYNPDQAVVRYMIEYRLAPPPPPPLPLPTRIPWSLRRTPSAREAPDKTSRIKA